MKVRGLQSDGVACERVTRGRGSGGKRPRSNFCRSWAFSSTRIWSAISACRKRASLLPPPPPSIAYAPVGGTPGSSWRRVAGPCTRPRTAMPCRYSGERYAVSGYPLGSPTTTQATACWWRAGTTVPMFITRRFRGRWSDCLPCSGRAQLACAGLGLFRGLRGRGLGSPGPTPRALADRKKVRVGWKSEAHLADSMRRDSAALRGLRVRSLLSP
jgi:hypothetical protein